MKTSNHSSYYLEFNGKELIKELEQVCEFRNQLTLDDETFEKHSKDSLKSIGKAIEILKVFDKLQKNYLIHVLREDNSIKDVQFRKR